MTSCYIQVNIEYKSGLKSFTLTPNRKHLGKSLARRSTYAIISDLMNNPGSRNYILKKIGTMLRQELTVMSSHKTKSILGSQDIADMKKFTWSKVLDELSLNAPILHSLLLSCTYRRRPRMNRDAIVGMCSAILLKFRYSRMSMVQRILSLILRAGSSGKQV